MDDIAALRIMAVLSLLGSSPGMALTGDLHQLPLAELLKLEIETVAKHPEPIADATGIVSVITRDDIERYGSNDLFDLLRRVPGLIAQNSIVFPDNLVSIRGMHSSVIDRRTLLLLDGRPIRDTQSGGSNATFYKSLPLSTIERIEVVRGPGSVLYGTNAVSGVINVITRTDSHSQVTLSAGTQDTQRLDGRHTQQWDQGQVAVSVKSMGSNGWEFKATDAGGAYDEQYLDHRELGVHLSANFGSLSLSAFEGNLEQDFLGSDQRWPADHYERQSQFVDLHYHHSLGQAWQADFNITYNRNNRATDRGGVDVESSNSLYELSLQGPIGNKMHLLSGITYLTLRGKDLYNNTDTYHDTWKSAYVQAETRWFEQLKLTLGVQYNDSGIEQDTSIRAGANWRFSPHWGAKLLYGEAFRSPYMAELSSFFPGSLLGNPSLNSEKVETISGQLFYHDVRQRVELTLFDSRLRDAIGLSPDPVAGFRFENGGELDVEGVELEGRVQLGNGWLLEGSYSHQQNTDENGVHDTQIDPNTLVKFGASYEWENGITLGLFNNYFGDPGDWNKLSGFSQERNPNDEAYHHMTLNLKLPLKLFWPEVNWQGAKISLFADNLLQSDSVYEPDISRPNVNAWPKFGPRTLTAKLAMKF
ncbi:TonB-dependent receptor [Pseudomaricurvus alkylphenolicus]|uniref:TonB-dependent receptor plug domain-containing protein n=1 Tax=Pseudomaricurvus alkylphenolicus TaxID=1306991 RepID=UPI00141E63DC|nr:TonB-dependent receptor [Pseudomaricurvus alkylphenolicus]NIB44550.1 TonB-dependent receptor [Pseudomaricurvus alkylphenolicus]